jgi:alkyl hydroperoxide reductase subunit AhpC
MTVKLGEIAPDFHAETTEGEIDFHDWAGDDWVVLFSHPADYTPVCTTELGRVASLSEKFKEHGVKPIGLSVDPLDDHKGWLPDIEETQNVEVDFPIIADADKEVANKYGMMHPEADDTHTVRSLFIIDSDKKVRLSLTYPAEIGRNFDELFRTLDALKVSDEYDVATPADWEKGDDVIVKPSLTDEAEIKERFGEVEELRPYLRLTRDPSS